MLIVNKVNPTIIILFEDYYKKESKQKRNCVEVN